MAIARFSPRVRARTSLATAAVKVTKADTLADGALAPAAF
jgi:hypothetical protein